MTFKNVHFSPWVPEDYKKGLVNNNGQISYSSNNGGKRLLVLGESHYCLHEEDSRNKGLTNEVISYYLKGKGEYEPWMSTYTKFERALLGKIADNCEREELWNHIAFYNYVQTALVSPRVSPSPMMYSTSADGFKEVLEMLLPDLVIVWGTRLYNNLPNWGHEGKPVILPTDDEDEEIETWIYEINGKHIRLLPIYHPSVGFSWDFWHKVILSFWGE